MNQFPDIERTLGIDLGAHAERARRVAQQSAELSERLTGLVGHAESADGRIGLAFSPERGLTDVRIDPRTMRMASEELAETIQRLSQEAVADLERRKQEIAREVYGEDAETATTPVDPAQMHQALRDMNDVFSGVSREATALMDQIRKNLGK
ncbi:YbaB/EbfC family nucleoid-associated protein [Actinomadura formosensis]|uniref:YbaB/EbfC family nucleoid-associated protein n=1 Tax=Actinomadura formosensis TaxID=60706 RepID=UPI00083040E6|nr:YbaB/EbfC family nucleoid-associated protein [Actinomadura formosensis]